MFKIVTSPSNRLYVLLAVIILLGGLALLLPGELAERKSDSDRFQEEPAIFLDGLWHGMIAPVVAPFYWLVEDVRPESADSTSEYTWGVRVGMAWVYLWMLGTVIAVFVSISGESSNDTVEEALFLFLPLCFASIGLVGGVLFGGILVVAVKLFMSLLGYVLGAIIGIVVGGLVGSMLTVPAGRWLFDNL